MLNYVKKPTKLDKAFANSPTTPRAGPKEKLKFNPFQMMLHGRAFSDLEKELLPDAEAEAAIKHIISLGRVIATLNI